MSLNRRLRIGEPRSKALRLLTVSLRVNQDGAGEFPLGSTAKGVWMRKLLLFTIGLLMTLVMALPTGAVAGQADGLVYGPNTHPHGASYEAWARRLGRFLAEPPLAENPLVHPTCDSIQMHGGVLFLPVATAEGLVAHCDIPADTPLLVSPGGDFRILGLDANTPRRIKRITHYNVNAIHDLVVKIDGHRIHRLDRFRNSSWVRIHLGADNIFGAPAGRYRLFIEGWAVIVRGFDWGRHTIQLGDVFLDGNGDEQVGTIKYVLTVVN